MGYVAIEQQFDLALSLEVAEHLPKSSADKFVGSICELAPLVLFSAAVPGQGGQGHINEQWPEYWAAKFAMRKFACYDLLRKLTWNNTAVEPWYRQKLLNVFP